MKTISALLEAVAGDIAIAEIVGIEEYDDWLVSGADGKDRKGGRERDEQVPHRGAVFCGDDHRSQGTQYFSRQSLTKRVLSAA